MSARWHRGVACTLAAASVASCAFHDLDFVQDRRLSILSPRDRSTVHLPVTVTWSVRDFRITREGRRGDASAGYFLVLIDTTPQPPGEPLSWLARKDRLCLATPGCPNDAWLARHQIYPTSRTEFTIRTLAPRKSSDVGGPNRHQVTIALLDPAGRRIGETAYSVAFEVEGGGSS